MKTLISAVSLVALSSLASGCAGAQKTPDAPPPALEQKELQISDQGLTQFTVTYQGVLNSTVPATLEKATYELVVEGKVLKTGEVPLNLTVPAGAPTTFEIKESSNYVSSAEELKLLDGRAGTLLTALRGKVYVRQGDGKAEPIEYARSREIRLPRMPKVVLHDVDAGRYSDSEVNGTLYLGVVNPNPFPVKLAELDYLFAVAGKKVGEGAQGRGEHVSPAATGVFEVGFTVNEETHGKEVKKLIASRTLPYEAKGALKGELFDIPYKLDGEIRLNVSK